MVYPRIVAQNEVQVTSKLASEYTPNTSGLLTVPCSPPSESKFPKTSMLFLTENGQLITTDNLFELDDSEFPDNELLSLFKGAIGRSNKLSGISKLEENKIKFYNGDVYEFLSEERTFFSSRGKITTESEPRKKFVKKQEYQWRIFMY